MIMLTYSALLTLGLLMSAPWWLFRMATIERYREGLRQRLGFVPASLRAAVADKRVVWLHAVSVGEVLAATRLVAELEAALGDGWTVAVSTTTRTGQALAQQRFGAERVFYMPLDFAFAVRACLRVLRPAALILMESELWPRLLHECSTWNIPVAVANARVSDRSFRRALRVRPLWQHLIRKPTLWLAQSDEDARRLLTLGARSETVQTSGNLKYDIRAPKESSIAELIEEVAAGRPVIVAGSTVGTTNSDGPHEEEILIEAWQDLAARDSGSLLVLAPRHPERFNVVYTAAIDTFSARASALRSLRGPNGFHIEYDVIVVDTIGDLSAIYRLADIAFVGGSLIPRGGHNPLEPAQFGVPVIMGPSYENFRDIVSNMQSVNAIRIVRNRDELESTFAELLAKREEAKALGQRGRAVFESQQGATARTVAAILTMIEAKR